MREDARFIGASAVMRFVSPMNNRSSASSSVSALQHGRPLTLHRSRPLMLHRSRSLMLHRSRPLMLHRSRPLMLHRSRPLMLHRSRPLMLHQRVGRQRERQCHLMSLIALPLSLIHI